jgi:hypothetical protein
MSIAVSGRAILMLPAVSFERLSLVTRGNAEFSGTDGATRAKTTHICSSGASFVNGLALTTMASIDAEDGSRVYVTAAAPETIAVSQHPSAAVLVGQFVDAALDDPADQFVHSASWTVTGATSDMLPMIESF